MTTEDNELSQQDIAVRDHCDPDDSWEQCIGYLMFVTQFPTRIQIADMTNAMDVVFPNRLGHEWAIFYKFQQKVLLVGSTPYTIVEAQKAMDRLYFDFSKTLKKRLESGLTEPKEEKLVDELRDWRRLGEEAKAVQMAYEENLRRTKKPRSEKGDYEPYRGGKYKKNQGYVRVDYPNGYRAYRPVRYCLGCGEILEKYVRNFCSTKCQDDYGVRENYAELLAKYFPNAHINKS